MSEEPMVIAGLLFTTTAFVVHVVTRYVSEVQTEIEVKDLNFSPERITFFGWWLVEFWFVLTLVHFYCALFRQNRHGRHFCNPIVFSFCPASLLSISFALDIVWMILWRKRIHLIANIFLNFASFFNWAAMTKYSRKLFTRNEYLHHRARSDLWFYRILGQNSIGMLAAWTTIMTVINYGTISVIYWNVDKIVADVGMASMLTFLLTAYLPFEFFLYEKQMRYVMSPYICVLWVSSVVIWRGGGESISFIYSIILLVLSGLSLLFRILATLVLHFYRPLSWSIFRSQLP